MLHKIYAHKVLYMPGIDAGTPSKPGYPGAELYLKREFAADPPKNS